jgi:predicted ATPase
MVSLNLAAGLLSGRSGSRRTGANMIAKVKIEFFKRFPNATFEVGDEVVLAGPNNPGKTTLLQAVAVWNLAMQRWLAPILNEGLV